MSDKPKPIAKVDRFLRESLGGDESRLYSFARGVYVSARDTIRTGPEIVLRSAATCMAIPTFVRKLRGGATYFQKAITKDPIHPWYGFTIAKGASGLVGIAATITLTAAGAIYLMNQAAGGNIDPAIYTATTMTLSNAAFGGRELKRYLTNKKSTL